MANRRAKQPHNHGDSLREELRNGKAEWHLAGSEEVAVAYLGVGKIYENGRNLRLAGCFYMRRRERERGGVVPHIGDRTPSSSQTGGARFPCSESLMGGPQSAFERWHESN
jgi:hypothetical protein